MQVNLNQNPQTFCQRLNVDSARGVITDASGKIIRYIGKDGKVQGTSFYRGVNSRVKPEVFAADPIADMGDAFVKLFKSVEKFFTPKANKAKG